MTIPGRPHATGGLRAVREEASEERLDKAIAVMDAFAARTGVTSDLAPTRYLWTDAFAVCNDVALREATGDDRFLARARRLVDQVHRVLGRHREDDPRAGWISGLSESDGGAHPTAGGLRIGKADNERSASEGYRPEAEWSRDGQYYHYLTKWMFALLRMAHATEDATYHRWAVELARAAHAGFVVRAPGRFTMHWKMSIDLSRPLVPTEGHHDALDGLVTFSCLAAGAPGGADPEILRKETEALRAMCEGRSWATGDALGIGGLLTDTLRCAQLDRSGHPTGSSLFGTLLRAAATSLRSLGEPSFLRLPALGRLAFRELGLALGLEAVERLETWDDLPVPADTASLYAKVLDDVASYVPVGRAILDFWNEDRHRAADTWADHRDISDVMWATCLVPEGFLSGWRS